MSAPPIPHVLPAHPHQLEVQEFDSYALIVDLRSAEDFAEDHLPGAVSVAGTASPSVLRVGASGPGGRDATTPLVVEDAALGATRRPPVTAMLDRHLARLTPGDAVLVYCDSGGRTSAAVAAELRGLGYDAGHLPGGWASYRNWVAASLEVLSLVLRFCRVRSAPGGAAQAVLDTLADQGLKVLSLDRLLGTRSCPGLCLDGESSLSQAGLETALVDALRRMDPARDVWVDEVLMLADRPAWPASLAVALSRSPGLRVELPLPQRVALLEDHLQRKSADASSLHALLDRAVGASAAGTGSDDEAGSERPGEAPDETVWQLQRRFDALHAERASACPDAEETALPLATLTAEAIWRGVSALPEPWPQALQPDPDQIRP